MTFALKMNCFCLQAAASALEAKVALLDANHIEHVDARLQVGLFHSISHLPTVPELKSKRCFNSLFGKKSGRHGGLMGSAPNSGSRGPGSSPGRVIVLCSWARHFTLTVPLFTQEYKWVPVNCQVNLMKCWGLPVMD